MYGNVFQLLFEYKFSKAMWGPGPEKCAEIVAGELQCEEPDRGLVDRVVLVFGSLGHRLSTSGRFV